MSFSDPGFEGMTLEELKEWLAHNDLSGANYDDLLTQLSVDFASALPGVVQSSIGGASGSIPQPSQGTSLVWDANQQLYVPATQPYASAGLGANTYSKVGYSISTTSSVATLLDSMSLTTKKAGASVIVSWGFTAYTTGAAGSETIVAVNIDGNAPAVGPPQNVSFYWNTPSQHTSLGPYYALFTNVPAGAHTINFYVAAWFGQLTMDANDHLSASAMETP